MGKQKRQRHKPHKENPTGLPSAKDFENEEAESVINEDRETALRRVYDEVQSVNLEEKLSGLQTIESMSCDSTLAVQIAQDGIAKMIGPLLIDKNVLIRASSATALRYIADSGKTEAHECLLKDDVMTPLCALLKQYYTDWQPKCKEKEDNLEKDEKDGFIQAITLLWTLCENNEAAVKCCNEENLISILIKYLNIAVYGIEIATVTAQCLLSLSEDNPIAIKKLKDCEDSLIELLNLEESNANASEICFKTIISGLLINLINFMENNPMSTVCKVVTVLSEAIAVDVKQLLSDLASILPHEKNAFSRNAQKKVRESKRIFDAQQQALEILANLCSEDQENDDSDFDDSDIVDSEIDDVNDVCMDEKPLKISSVPLEVVEVFSSCNILQKVWEKTTPVDQDTVEILEQNIEGKAILQQMHRLNCRAYLCLNNLLSSLEIDTLGDIENLYRMWINMGTVVFKNANPNDIELLESATAAMRATLQRLSDAKANIFNQLTLNDIQPMLNGERQCSNANVRANLVRMLGSLALILINNDTTASHELIKHISIFLLDTCSLESKAWVMAESLDALMDIYAEDETDQLASDIQLVEKLHAIVPQFKNKARQQKKTLGDNVAVVSTVNTNIMRFIKYKQKRIKNI